MKESDRIRLQAAHQAAEITERCEYCPATAEECPWRKQPYVGDEAAIAEVRRTERPEVTQLLEKIDRLAEVVEQVSAVVPVEPAIVSNPKGWQTRVH